MNRRHLLATTALLAMAAPAAAADARQTFALTAPTLAGAIAEVAAAAQVDVAAPAELVTGAAPALPPALTAREALEHLIAGRGLELVVTGERRFAIRARTAGDAAASSPAESEIVVTGTRIRGAAPVGAPLQVLGRDEIDRSGQGSTAELVSSLPQNFGGGASGDTRIGNDASGNIAGGTGLNLRGLGNDSTLVLINGRRAVQGGGVGGSFVDVSALPLALIERVEILGGGASALYGSDAIAGVVNFVLTSSLDGGDARLRWARAPDGHDDRQASLAFGDRWSGGSLVVGYDFRDRDPLLSAKRRYAADSDLRRLGGSNFSITSSNPASIRTPVVAAVPEGGATRAADLRLGEVNFGNINEGRDLLVAEQRHAGLLSLRQELDTANLYLDARASTRDFVRRTGGEPRLNEAVPSLNPFFVTPVAGASRVTVDYNLIDDLGPVTRSGRVRSFDTTAGADVNLGGSWRGDVYLQWGKETTTAHTANVVNSLALAEALGVPLANGTADLFPNFDPRRDGFFNPFGPTAANVLNFVRGFSNQRFGGDLLALSAKADGVLGALPGGDIRLAVGIEGRRERFDAVQIAYLSTPAPAERTALGVDASRRSAAAYAELRVPLVGEGNARPGFKRLILSAAGRVEHYSDFGWAADPQLGLSWSPVEGIALRASYATAFNAPQLSDLTPVREFSFIFDQRSPGGTTRALVLQGSNPGLDPERARTLTFGVDVAPAALPGLTAKFDYFDIRYRDRIATAGDFNLFLFDPLRYAPVIQRDPDDALVQRFIDSPGFVPFGPIPPVSTVAAVLDARLYNLSELRVRGLDVDVGYAASLGAGRFDAGVNLSLLFDYQRRLLATAPLDEVVDTLGNPLALKARARLGYGVGAWQATAFINQSGGYRDPVSAPARRVDALTTLDLQLAWRPQDRDASGWRAALSVQNLFDTPPPFANNPAGVGYDAENFDPMGRVVALEIGRRF